MIKAIYEQRIAKGDALTPEVRVAVVKARFAASPEGQQRVLLIRSRHQARKQERRLEEMMCLHSA
jgi:hypothetical protein